MSLNIKNERVHDLARQAAAVTGMTKTGVIEEALVRLLNEYRERSVGADMDLRWAEIHEAIDRAEETRRALPEDERLELDEESLYDPETGLPA